MLDLSDLYPADADVLNGIAYARESGHLLVTGKYWPWLYALEVDGGAPAGR